MSVVDARGLFDCLTAADVGKISDKTSLIWVLAYRESLQRRYIRWVMWVSTGDMLADSMTKAEGEMEPWEFLYETGYWGPMSHPELPED